jgi:hypothetical protein
MVWYDVDIGGITPVWVLQEAEINPEAHTIKLRCAAIQEFLGADPQTEIDNLNALASLGEIKNEGLVNLGTKLFSSNYITVVINNRTYTKCALHPIVTVIDEYYAGPDLGSVLEYEVNIEYEADGLGGSVTYTPFYNKEDYEGELEYHFFYDPVTGQTWDTTADFTPQTKFTEGGIWTFTRDTNIKRVEVYGNGDNPNNFTLVEGFGDRSYIEVNKSGRTYWTEIEADDGITVPGLEGWGWDLHTKLTVVLDADSMDTELTIVPVKGGILDGTVLTLESGTGPEEITLNGDYAEDGELITVDALAGDVTAGAVYGIDRRVVVISTGPKVPCDAAGHPRANSNYGCYLAYIRLVFE